MEHHDAAVRGASERYAAYPGALALVLGGSVAHGTERADSDIDLTLVLTDDAYAQHSASERVSFAEDVPEYYEHAYFDVKVVTLGQLALAVESGDDPVRASHLDGRVLWAADRQLGDHVRELLTAVAHPPESHWLDLEVAFLAQARLHGRYFLAQAEQLDLRLLRHHAAVHFVYRGRPHPARPQSRALRGPEVPRIRARVAADRPAGPRRQAPRFPRRAHVGARGCAARRH